ncbi:Cy21 [Cynomolgus cytomegalovirus]|uniref:Protein UL9a n=1 Tax=Cynomolgus macaque cytomegalovirus strain Mauritius TaxID=1690255 RepID=A0A0K1H0G9_9BETA|nr:Cy21 [Cynomolgus cytomegalovirus]AKT72754.1 protein UL9a [Cynomolgus macaque cytomegalovirus strain Mauritius]APT39237.1 Cy21 [Cynomolgus cytomegalovirus]APT39410.1 Cy21 [Cynomolgus cytomegalovirus]APT39583.1 Cy21 [Cynomolgus cytomegalovirus]APT39756.1 Cy21 [Cynomolgus cytomegalovirus]
MYTLNLVMIIVYVMVTKTLLIDVSTYLRCKSDFGSSRTCTQQNKSAYTGQNVTLGINMTKDRSASWHRKTIQGTMLLCQYSDSTNCNSYNDICYRCLSNYSLLLLDVTSHYNGLYYLSYLNDNNQYADLCYNLTINIQLNISQTLINRTTIECIPKSNININTVKNKNVNNKRITNIESYTNHSPNIQYTWMLLPFIITIAIVLIWNFMPKKYSRLKSHREYTRIQY